MDAKEINNNANEPAYPVVETKNTESISLGISKLEYFAAHAPKIPDWFTHTPIGEVPQLPSWQDLPDGDDKETVKSWQRDPCWDLPEELMWFQNKLKSAIEQRDKWYKEDEVERYFQWRVFYAERMLHRLSPSPDKPNRQQ